MQNFRKVLEIVGDQVWEYGVQTGSFEIADGDGPWTGTVHPDDLELLLDIRAGYRSGRISRHRLEYRLLSADGGIIWVLDRGALMEKDDRGKPSKVIGAFTDITRHKQTEEELGRRVRQFDVLAENIPGVIFEYEYRSDGTEGFRYISPAVQRVFGVDAGGLQEALNVIDPLERSRINALGLISREQLRPFYTELQLNFPGTGRRWCAVHSAYSFRTADGATVFTGLISDVTEQHLAEEALRINEEKYRNIIANMNLGLLEVDPEERVTYANQRFCTMSGFAIEDLLSKKASSILLDETGAAIVAEKQALRRKGLSDAYELQLKQREGEVRWWLVSAAPRYNDQGKLIGSLGIHLDITERKRMEEELIVARENAEHLAGAKEQFLAHMSHELRTPLNAIIGMAAQLDKTALLPAQRSLLETVHTAAEQLLAIVNDILDLSKLEAGKLPLEENSFELGEVFGRAMLVLSPKAEEKGLQLRSDIAPAIAPVLTGDPFRLNQVLLNLLSNAIKFTEKGEVTLSARLLHDQPDTQRISIQVSDTGTGMDAGFLAHLFDKFSQEHRSVSRRYGGTGLGMSICRELVSLMGGTIEATSSKGRGTTMTMILPLGKGDLNALNKPLPINYPPDFLRGKTILVADDNGLNRKVAALTLEGYGAKVLTAQNGLEVLASCQAQHADLVLMDLQMPELDGYGAAAQLRANGYLVPIIALTAEAVSGEREKCTVAGMDDYLSKPFREEGLLQLIGASLFPPEPLYDLSGLERAARGSQEFIAEMTGLFCVQAAQVLETMRQALLNGELEKLSAAAHQLKPSVDTLQIAGGRSLVRELEKAPAHHKNPAELAMLYGKFSRYIRWSIARLTAP